MPALEFNGVQRLLLDIEGTTSSVSFVYDVMFPMVRERLDAYLLDHWDDPALEPVCDQIANDAGQGTLQQWQQTSHSDPRELIAAEVRRLMDGDVKATGLKQLQGMIWKSGFESGELQAHVYPDVPDAIAAWRDAGLDVRIYSSGSIQAQRLFFGHTIVGDLLSHFSGHYDTTIGSKRESASYAAIAEDWAVPPESILFASDVVAELDAAREAGLQTVLLKRPGNAEPPADHTHPSASSFSEFALN